MSVLTDEEIVAAVKAGTLIKKGDEGHVGPACYELRAGPIYYDLTEGDRRIDATPQGTVLIKPGHRVVLISLEEVDIPNDMLARVASKGSLFSVGLSPVSTYADPGFAGNVGIVTQNMSDKYLVLPIGEPIAKIDFSRLSKHVARPYRGQHGFHTQIWPIRHQLQKSHADVKHDPRVEAEDKEANKVIPAATVVALKEMKRTQGFFYGALLLLIIINAVMFAYLTGSRGAEFWFAIGTNLIASIFFALFWKQKN